MLLRKCDESNNVYITNIPRGGGTAALSQGGKQPLTRQGEKLSEGNHNNIFLKFHKTAKFLSFIGKYSIFRPLFSAAGGEWFLNLQGGGSFLPLSPLYAHIWSQIIWNASSNLLRTDVQVKMATLVNRASTALHLVASMAQFLPPVASVRGGRKMQ